jgi:hypothetical protein
MAEINLLEMLEILKNDSIPSVIDIAFCRYTALNVLSLCFYDRIELVPAEETVQACIKLALSEPDLEGDAIASYSVLEDWLRKWGQPEEAEEARVWRLKLEDEAFPEDEMFVEEEIPRRQHSQHPNTFSSLLELLSIPISLQNPTQYLLIHIGQVQN